jgi:hypothetical protein
MYFIQRLKCISSASSYSAATVGLLLALREPPGIATSRARLSHAESPVPLREHLVGCARGQQPQRLVSGSSAKR